MRKYTLAALFLFQTVFVVAQISTTAPPITRGTPSVASLANFAEIPVNKFTGVPNISIPLFNFPTRSKDISLDVSLGYHPASISLLDKASDVGSGWSLMSDGVISRTIVYIPDGPFTDPSNPSTPSNNFDDVYNYNFMGHSGRFLIVRDSTTGNFSVQMLDNTTLKIYFDMNMTTYAITSFTVYDDKGYKYLFDNLDWNIEPFQIPTATPWTVIHSPFGYATAHHLTKVVDNNGEDLLNYYYRTETEQDLLYTDFDNVRKKIDSIVVKGVGKVEFDFDLESTFEDQDNDPFSLTSVVIKDADGALVKKYGFTHSLYSTRRTLDAINEYNSDLTSSKPYYQLFYKTGPVNPLPDVGQEEYVSGVDFAGYPNIIPKCDPGAYIPSSTDISPNVCDTGVIQKMVLPTGGSILYEFEPNTTSADELPSNPPGTLENEFYELRHNYTPTLFDEIDYNMAVSNTEQFTVTGTSPKKLYFKFENATYTNPDDPGNIIPVRYVIMQGTTEIVDFNYVDPFLTVYDVHDCMGRMVELAPGTYTMHMSLFPGLSVFTTGTITISEKVRNTPLKKWFYSGGIRIKKIAHFDIDVEQDYLYDPLEYSPIVPAKEINYSYQFFDDVYKSSGQIIGGTGAGSNPQTSYLNVKVFDTGENGYTKYTYEDARETLPGPTDPQYHPYYLAYREGLIKKIEVYDNSTTPKLLSQTDNTYDFTEIGEVIDNAYYIGGNATKLAWAKLSTSVTNSFFFPTGQIQTTENYTYNTTNRLLESKTIINSMGEDVTTNYTYDTSNSSISENRISEILKIETLRNAAVLSTSEIDYDNTWTGNISYLPKTIMTSKESQSYEDRIHYNLYDEYSNPLEIQQEGGTVVSYIWGYNKTQPIAKIENATNAQIATALGLTLSSVNESNMSAINALRASLPDAMITTYTYIPLIGISTITDPKGDYLTYVYDDYNRLKWVKDRDGKILSENQYYYRTSNSEMNYVKSTTYKTPTSTSISTPTASQAVVNKTFFDGLGRPVQQIAHQQSNTGKDIVTHIEYDALGRKVKDYLPYTNTTASLDYNPYAKSELEAYAQYVGQFPYSEKLLEASPLNRLLRQGAPGEVWQVNSTGPDHTIKLDYQTNSLNEVKLFTATTRFDSGLGLFDLHSFDDLGYYSKNNLYKSIVKNENWTSGDSNTTQEFKDKEGRIILKRTFGVSDVGGTPTNTAHDTYYVYDEYGNLTYVLPPLADGTIDQNVLDNLCYQYKYDARNRLVEKKSPGKQWEFIVYDKLDRVIATGPALSPFTDSAPETYGWLITKYDALGRNILTAWAEGENSTEYRYTLQDAYNTSTDPLFETRASSATTVNNVSFKYTNVSLPTSDYHVLSVNYFDDYDYPGAPTVPSTVLTTDYQNVYYNNTIKPKGLATGSWVRIVEESTTTPVRADVSYILYNDKARVVRARTANYLGGYTQVDTKLDFEGKTIFTETKHKRVSSDTEIYIREDFTYSNQSRLIKHFHQIGSADVELLSKKEYNELGQLISKWVGGKDDAGLQHIDYTYNIRGWLTSINNIADLTVSSDPADLFAFSIGYNGVDEETSASLYNGNIAEIYWLSNSDNVLRKYSYEYDHLNRLKNAVYQKPSNSIATTNSYNESMTYDKNGNITSLQRNGDLDTDALTITIDDLEYSYDTDKKNQLLRVADSTNHPEGFKDDMAGDTNDDYTYDANGNMVSDTNKSIYKIKYNHLSLPLEILFGAGDKIEYLYDAAGRKVRKSVTDDGNGTVHTDYINGFQYTYLDTAPAELKFFPHAEGYVNNTVVSSVNVYNYVYNYTDHLGNIRMTYTWDEAEDALKILEENHYYPYGLKHSKYNSDTWVLEKDGYNTGVAIVPGINLPYQYKLNSKEWQDELGLNVYAMDMRQYDPAIARWTVQDPVIHHNFSPYNAFDNNPAYFADPSGADSTDSFYTTDIQGRARFDSVTKMFIAPNDRVDNGAGPGTYEGSYIVGGGDEEALKVEAAQNLVATLQNLLNMGIKYDFNSETTLMQGNQNSGTWECSYHNKLSADAKFNVPGQEEINKKWLNYANKKDKTKPYLGLKPNEIIEWYKKAGYQVNEFKGQKDNKNALPWMFNEMEAGKIVQMVIGTKSGHNVSVIGLHFNKDFKQAAIEFMNPIRSGDKSKRGIGSNVNSIYSVKWP